MAAVMLGELSDCSIKQLFDLETLSAKIYPRTLSFHCTNKRLFWACFDGYCHSIRGHLIDYVSGDTAFIMIELKNGSNYVGQIYAPQGILEIKWKQGSPRSIQDCSLAHFSLPTLPECLAEVVLQFVTLPQIPQVSWFVGTEEIVPFADQWITRPVLG